MCTNAEETHEVEGDSLHNDRPEPSVTRPAAVSYLWGGVGLISFALGTLGAALPFIPTTPFILLAAVCFARSSRRLNRWFRSTKLYKTVFESLVARKTMSIAAKLKILIPVTVLLGASCAFMSSAPVGRIVVTVIWIGHIVYFGFLVKTDSSRPSRSRRLQRQLRQNTQDVPDVRIDSRVHGCMDDS